MHNGLESFETYNILIIYLEENLSSQKLICYKAIKKFNVDNFNNKKNRVLNFNCVNIFVFDLKKKNNEIFKMAITSSQRECKRLIFH